MEFQKFNASANFLNPTPGASNVNDKLNSFKANATFVWDHTYSLTAGYFNVSGTSDPLWDTAAYNGAPTPPLVSSPNGSGMIFDAAYLPFSHGAPGPYKYANVRIGVQYTTYFNLYGGTNNFDGSGLGGTHNASGNNTAFVYAWAAF